MGKINKHDPTFDDHIKTIPLSQRENIEYVLTHITRGNKFYNEKSELVYRSCTECSNTKSIDQFNLRIRKEKIKQTTYREIVCKECKGYLNSIKLIECGYCSKTLKKSEFSHNNSIPKGYRVGLYGKKCCDSCYVKLPNNHITRRGEFNGKVKVRVYDNKNKFVEKRCIDCKKILPLKNFNISTKGNIWDGYNPRCFTCNTLKTRENNKRKNPNVIHRVEIEYKKGMDLSKLDRLLNGEEIRNDHLIDDIFSTLRKRSIGKRLSEIQTELWNVIEEFKVKRDRFSRVMRVYYPERLDKELSDIVEEQIPVRFNKLMEVLKEVKGRKTLLWKKKHWFKKHRVNINELNEWFRKDPRKKELYEKKSEELKSVPIPKKLKNQIYSSSNGGFLLYNEEGNITHKYCHGCDKHHPKIDFLKKYQMMGGLSSLCVRCRLRKRGINLKGGETYIKEDFKDGIRIKRRNSVGSVVDIRCNSCLEFKPKNEFWTKNFQTGTFRMKLERVCEDCYVQIPNNQITRRGEFYNSVHMRKYDDDNNFIEKRCGRCKTMKKTEEFNKSMKYWDGFNSECRECNKSVNRKNRLKRKGEKK